VTSVLHNHHSVSSWMIRYGPYLLLFTVDDILLHCNMQTLTNCCKPKSNKKPFTCVSYAWTSCQRRLLALEQTVAYERQGTPYKECSMHSLQSYIKDWCSLGDFPRLASVLWVVFSASTWLVGWQEGNLVTKNLLKYIKLPFLGTLPKHKYW